MTGKSPSIISVVDDDDDDDDGAVRSIDGTDKSSLDIAFCPVSTRSLLLLDVDIVDGEKLYFASNCLRLSSCTRRSKMSDGRWCTVSVYLRNY